MISPLTDKKEVKTTFFVVFLVHCIHTTYSLVPKKKTYFSPKLSPYTDPWCIKKNNNKKRHYITVKHESYNTKKKKGNILQKNVALAPSHLEILQSNCFTLTRSVVDKNFSRPHTEIVFLFFPRKVWFDISCKLSPQETICMKCQILFLSKIEKIFINLSSVELSQKVVMVESNIQPKQEKYYIISFIRK